VSLHSGAHKRRVRTQYRVATGGSDGVSELEWRVGQLNVMVALSDVKAGDGGTVRRQTFAILLLLHSPPMHHTPCVLADAI
jgi:hypothetical protein